MFHHMQIKLIQAISELLRVLTYKTQGKKNKPSDTVY